MPKTALEESTERLRLRNESLAAFLNKDASMVVRVAESPDIGLEDITDRARKYWDSKSVARKSIPPKK